MGFDLNDLAHYPSLRQAEAPAGLAAITVPGLEAVPLDRVAGALKTQEPMVLWCENQKAAEVRLAVSGNSLAVHIRSCDAQVSGAPETWARSIGRWKEWYG